LITIKLQTYKPPTKPKKKFAQIEFNANRHQQNCFNRKINMKNLLNYYLLILTPLGLMIWLLRTEFINSFGFVGLMLFYTFIYRTYIDGKRLADKNIIAKKDIWKMVIPGSRISYFKELYLK